MARADGRGGRAPAIAAMGLVTAVLAIGAGLVLARDTKPGVVPNPTASSAFCTVESPETKGKKTFPSEPCKVIDESKFYLATMRTSMGTIRVIVEPKLGPRTANSFVFLARQGYYDNTTFHRIQNVEDPDPLKDYAVVEGGDPTGTGAGGPGYTFGEPPPPITRYIRGEIVLGRKARPNSNGSQFFFVVRDWEELEPQYTLFGKVADEESMAVLDRMVEAPGSAVKGGIGFTPNPPIKLISVTIEEKERT